MVSRLDVNRQYWALNVQSTEPPAASSSWGRHLLVLSLKVPWGEARTHVDWRKAWKELFKHLPKSFHFTELRGLKLMAALHEGGSTVSWPGPKLSLKSLFSSVTPDHFLPFLSPLQKKGQKEGNLKIKGEGKRRVQTGLSIRVCRRKEETGSKVTVLQLTNAEQSPFLLP